MNLTPTGYVVRADENRAVEAAVRWSNTPDGRTILLVRLRDSSEIFAVNPDGSGLRKLYRSLTIDGRQARSRPHDIVFVSRRDGRYGMYLMKHGSGQWLLTRAGRMGRPHGGPQEVAAQGLGPAETTPSGRPRRREYRASMPETARRVSVTRARRPLWENQ